jgi:hypothetical protein
MLGESRQRLEWGDFSTAFAAKPDTSPAVQNSPQFSLHHPHSHPHAALHFENGKWPAQKTCRGEEFFKISGDNLFTPPVLYRFCLCINNLESVELGGVY